MPFDEFGNYRQRVVKEANFFDAVESTDSLDTSIDRIISAHEHELTRHPRDYELLRPYFGWASKEVVRRTFDCTTQNARMPVSDSTLKQTYKSPFPALNVHRRNEAVATDTVYADVPAINDGSTCAQLFFGRTSLVADAYGMKTDGEYVNTLEDNIRERGAMDKIISDRAQAEVSNRVKGILRAYCIEDWQSEPHYQHQNFAEGRYKHVKNMTNTVLNRTGAPAFCWLLCLLYVCFLMNSTAAEAFDYTMTPLTKLTGQTNDISMFLYFRFWEAVYYNEQEPSFPGDSTEKRGRFVGVARNVGHALTYKVLTDDTQEIIFRSRIRSAAAAGAGNLRVNPVGGEMDTTPPPILKFRDPRADGIGETDDNDYKMQTLQPTDLVGRTFLMDQTEDGQRP